MVSTILTVALLIIAIPIILMMAAILFALLFFFITLVGEGIERLTDFIIKNKK